ncbi:acyl-CoA dehydrogenase family protein [Sphingomonas sp. A2-49]|uniref:acyl-CoA dehydrogenase family protein n=1 Tax=Sphingomonas sp. A2-49 TaxID=1391375 RepID=UPI0021CE3EEC|nr:acyl-CoA dehydrogenase family protein [Sphingomonas sp. A2-49]MCU6453118.1 acyl-CoA dehydrogenase family protein [Sphingomonas sp. A2-49]
MRLTDFAYAAVPSDAELLRQEIRAFLAREMEGIAPVVRADSWLGYDAAFSRKLGEAGLIGLTMPERFGGRGGSAFARYVVSEELLAAGAPVSAHWIADRQSAPLLLRYGTQEQQDLYIPAIVRGESYFCIGMSEPNSGSDLASIGSRAVAKGTGWRLNGRKVWTTNAHRSDVMIALIRTEGGGSDDRHGGMSQFLIDLHAPGVTVRPIRDLSGGEHFNEVFFDDVALDRSALIGVEGQGWQQVMAELAFERSGPERFLSSMALMHTLIDQVGPEPDALQAFQIGRITARLMALRAMSLSVTAQLDAGEDPAWAASCVKDVGTALEQELPEVAQLLDATEPRVDSGSDHAQVLAYLTQLAPSFSLRGGTREILRGILARGLGVR